MTVWRSFGASVIGPAHVAAGIANQDAWSSFHHPWGDGIVVADGLGSKRFSDFGSRAACLAVAWVVRVCHKKAGVDYALLAELIRKKWLSLITPLDPSDCATTCMFAFRHNDGMVRMGLLGDGLAATVKTDGSVVLLAKDHSEGFSNITRALSKNVEEKDWRWLSLPEEECQTIILCTDGVSDDLSDAKGFIREFFEAHRGLAAVSAARRIRKVLENWPTPKHTDDKTIACLSREEGMDD